MEEPFESIRKVLFVHGNGSCYFVSCLSELIPKFCVVAMFVFFGNPVLLFFSVGYLGIFKIGRNYI